MKIRKGAEGNEALTAGVFKGAIWEPIKWRRGDRSEPVAKTHKTREKKTAC